MKYHFKIFLISAFVVLACAILSQVLGLESSAPVLAQAQSISYFVTLAGIVVLYGWYNRRATPVKEGEETPADNIKRQHTVLKYMLFINVVNAAVLCFSTSQPVQLMTAISLLVVLISPMIFRTMQEKLNYADDADSDSKGE